MRIDNTRDERAKRARANKLAAGLVSRALYLPAETVKALAERFPGPAGGIAWEKVAAAALRPEQEEKHPKAAGAPPKDPTAAERARRYRANKKARAAAQATTEGA